VYTIAAFGSIFGGWLPFHFIKKGSPVFRARKRSMLIYALCTLPVVSAQLLGGYNMWFAISIIGFAAAAHQAWSANIFTTVSDMFPKATIASVTGIGGMAGGLGGLLVSKLAGYLFDFYKSLGHIETGYLIMFVICGLAYIIAWLLMHLLVPTMKPIAI
jgi:ACS family hexuronate transporter-like MFS transporter